MVESHLRCFSHVRIRVYRIEGNLIDGGSGSPRKFIDKSIEISFGVPSDKVGFKCFRIALRTLKKQYNDLVAYRNLLKLSIKSVNSCSCIKY